MKALVLMVYLRSPMMASVTTKRMICRWWRSLLWSGSCAGWMLLYSIGYYFTALNMEGVSLFLALDMVNLHYSSADWSDKVFTNSST